MADITKIDRFIQNSPHPAWLATAQGHCVYGNPALERLTGLNSDQINRADWRSFLLEKDRAVASASWQRSLVTGTPYRVEVRMRGSDDVPKWVELIAFGHKAGDNPELWLFSALEVNGVPAQELPELEAQIQATLNVIPAYTWYALPSGVLTFVNERTANYLGLPKDHPLRFGIDTGAEWDSHTALLHPDDREESRRAWSTCLNKGSAGEFNFRVRSAEGKYRWFLSRAETLRANDGTLLFWIGVNLDVDDAKRAEDPLRKSEKELRDAIDTISATVWSALPDGSNIYVNKHFVEYSGAPAEQTVGAGWKAKVHPDDLERHAGKWMEAIATGKPLDNEVRFRRSDGQYRWHLDRGVPLRDEDGNIVKWYGVAIDIEDRKRAEEALQVLSRDLQESNAKLEEAQRITHVGYWEWDMATNGLKWSDETYRIYGMRPQECPMDFAAVRKKIHPEDWGIVSRALEEAASGGAHCDVECRVFRPTGEVRIIDSQGHVKRDTSGRPTRMFGTVQDITERKRAEEKIREQEMEFRQILDLAPQQLGVFGSNGERLFANRTALDYVRLSLEEWQQMSGNVFCPGGFFHPDDRERAARAYSDGRSSGSAYDLELRVQGADGNYRWFLVRFNPLRDDRGQVKRWYLASTDIDERKRAEEKLQQENLALREEIDKASMFEEIVGTSMPLKAVLSRIAKVAPTDSTVLVTGETGTGKELIARAAHKQSRRSGHAFVSVSCAALAPTLISSELFGHEKGAFTGATQRRIGRFELADGGTIFLDEVGELPPDTQVALLRVLQEREFERVGGTQSIKVDVRVIAATNRDLQAAVANGTFRQDLFYRLNVFPIEVPPVRERKDDILMLVEYFVQRYATGAGKHIRSIDKKTLDLLQSYDWPGNIRELQNVIERSVILSSGDVFSVDELWLSKETARTASRVEAVLVKGEGKVEPRSEREIIEAALAESRGRVYGLSGAAAKLGISTSTLDRRIKALEIHKKRFKLR